MPKERRILSKVSNKARVSPHESELLIQSEWEDVRCVICMEPPHNAVLLHCSSFSKGCRSYMCDTSVHHSNCFNQFCKNNENRLIGKALNCPLCRAEVNGTVKVTTSARRFMNAKRRPCSADNCKYFETYSELDKHFKATHLDLIPSEVDPWRQWRWEQMQRYAEYMDMMSAAETRNRFENVHHQLMYSHHHSMIHMSVNGYLQSHVHSRHEMSRFGVPYYTTSPMPRFGVPNYTTSPMLRLEYPVMSMFPRWNP